MLLDELKADILSILKDEQAKPFVRQKAALCLLAAVRVRSKVGSADELLSFILPMLEQTYNLGLSLSLITLLYGLAKRNPDPYSAAVPTLAKLADKIVLARSIPPGYFYHDVPCPILQAQLFRLLQLFEIPAGETARTSILRVLAASLGPEEESQPPPGAKISQTVEPAEALGRGARKDPYKTSALNMITIAAVNLSTHYGEGVGPHLIKLSIEHLAGFLGTSDSNVRYLGLASLSRLAQAAQRDGLNKTLALIRTWQPQVTASLRDGDESIRRKALDLLFAMCDADNADTVVSELLRYLEAGASYSIKCETVLKIAILAERHAADSRAGHRWYVDTVLHLVRAAGEYVSDDVWHRLIRVVTNQESVQTYAARALLDALAPQHVHETTLKVGAHLLGEFGYLLIEEGVDETPTTAVTTGAATGGSRQISPIALFETMNQHFSTASNVTRCMLFHAYVKLAHMYPSELRDDISLLLDAYRDASDAELQQRACEYYQVIMALQEPERELILEPMPTFTRDSNDTNAARNTKSKLTGNNDETTYELDEARFADMSIVVEDDHIRAGNLAPAIAAAGPLLAAPPAPSTMTNLMSDAANIKRYSKLLIEPKGLLFEDENIQVGAQHQYAEHDGKLMLFYGNKSSGPLVNVISTITSTPNILVAASPLDPVLQVGAQARQSIQIGCMIPFADPPAMFISYEMPGAPPKVVDLRLPIALLSFATPVETSANEFEQRWSAITTERTSDLHGIGMPHGPTIAQLLQKMHFSLLPFQTGASEIQAACCIHTGTVNPSSGKLAKVGCLLQVALSGPNCRVSVRAMNPTAATSVLDTVHLLLSSLVA